jgi:hypothetical protein
MLVWACNAQLTLLGMMDGCARGFEFPRQLLVALISLAMVLLILAFGPQRSGSRSGKLSLQLVPAVAVLSVLLDWSLVLVAVYPMQPPR